MKDLIERQMAIDALHVWFSINMVTEKDMSDHIHDLKLIINHIIGLQKVALRKLPSAQAEQRWIPVAERLPEKEGWYITTVESEKTGKRRIENDLFAVDIALAHGHTPNKFCKDGHRQRTVAWMPFPEPYQGGTGMIEEKMQDDLISRKQAVELIERMKPYHQDADDIAEMIDNMPSAQPERKKGRWIDAVIPNNNGGLPVIVCDQCVTFFPLEFGASHNFCPNCGADMRGEQDE